MAAEVLTAEEIRSSLLFLNQWSINENQLHKTYQFKNFVEAFGFMTKVALIAESMNHHPIWSNVYNIVNVNLSTHDSGGITKLDIDLAGRMDKIV